MCAQHTLQCFLRSTSMTTAGGCSSGAAFLVSPASSSAGDISNVHDRPVPAQIYEHNDAPRITSFDAPHVVNTMSSLIWRDHDAWEIQNSQNNSCKQRLSIPLIRRLVHLGVKQDSQGCFYIESNPPRVSWHSTISHEE